VVGVRNKRLAEASSDTNIQKNRQRRNSFEFDAAMGFLKSLFPQRRSIARSRGEKAGF
jgi:hypothetical protein